MDFEPLYSPQNVGSGLTSTVLFAPVAFFASNGIKGIPEGLTCVTDTHQFQQGKGFLQLNCAPWKNKLNADSIGEAGSMKFGTKLEFFMPGTYASLHAFLRKALNAPGVFLVPDADDPDLLYQLGRPNSYAYLSASFDTGTEKEGQKGWKITVETYADGLIDYVGAVTYFESGVVVVPTDPEPLSVYWGYKSTKANLTNAQIKATTPHTYVPGADITVDFGNLDAQWMWLAIPETELGIISYEVIDNTLDFGPLGPGSTFLNWVKIGDVWYLQSSIKTDFGSQLVKFKH